MLTAIMFAVGTLLLAIGEAIAVAKHTDSQEPLTYYIRHIFKSLGALGFLLMIAIWLWLGCHFALPSSMSC